MRDFSSVLHPDHAMYTEAVEALKRYHEAQANGVAGPALERLQQSQITNSERWAARLRRATNYCLTWRSSDRAIHPSQAIGLRHVRSDFYGPSSAPSDPHLSS